MKILPSAPGGSVNRQATLQDAEKITNHLKENMRERTQTFFAVVLLPAIGRLAPYPMPRVKFVGVGSSAHVQYSSAAAFTDLCSARSGSDCITGRQRKNSGDNQNVAREDSP